jgi:hypothetical protein
MAGGCIAYSLQLGNEVHQSVPSTPMSLALAPVAIRAK